MLIFNQYFGGVFDSLFGCFFLTCDGFNFPRVLPPKHFTEDSVAYIDSFALFVFDSGHVGMLKS